MKSSTDYRISPAFACLLVGEPKTAKTCVAMSFPDPWFLDIDGNLASAVRRNPPTKRFFYDSVSDIPLEKRYDACEALVRDAAASKDVKTLVLDSTTTFTSVLRDHILHRLRTAGVKLRSDTIDDQLRQTDYQTIATFLLRMVALFRASGKYVIWTSHQKVDKDELTGALRYKLNIPGVLSESLGAYFTDVWAMTCTPAPGGKVKYSIRTKPTGYHVSLGASFPIDSEVDITDKSPDAIWSILGPKITTI